VAHLFIFGLGYSAKRVRAATEARGWTVSATGSGAELAFEDDEGVHAALGAASHVLSSVPPGEAGDPVLTRYGDALRCGWLGYLSSTGVYGDTGGAWVDETAPVGGGRRAARSARGERLAHAAVQLDRRLRGCGRLAHLRGKARGVTSQRLEVEDLEPASGCGETTPDERDLA